MSDVLLAASRRPAALPSASRSYLHHGAALCFAVLSHGSVFWLASQATPNARPEPLSVTEVSLLPPEPPAAVPPVAEPAEPEKPGPTETPAPTAPRPAAARTHATKAPAEPKPLAKAGAVRTANEDAPTPSAQEPVRFVSDPNGTGFGFGEVAQGGTAQEARSKGPSVASTPQTGKGGASAPKPAMPYQGALASRPRPRHGDPCRGYFPKAAHSERGEARVHVTVSAEGQALLVKVLSEQPSGQGFGPAAHTCLTAARFEPARDLQGRAVTVVAPITVKFSR